MRTLRGRLAQVAAMAAMAVAVAACGADGNDTAAPSGGTGAATGDAATTQSGAGPESHIAPDAEVTAGLGRLKGVADRVAGAAAGAASKAAARGLEPVWQPIEGTVKQNEPGLYLDIEDAFQRMESGDLANAKRGAQAMGTAVDSYLARHPG